MLVDIGWQTRRQNVALESLLHWLVHLNTMLLLSMDVMPKYHRFTYCWLVYVNIEPSLVVGWFEVELFSGLRLL